MQTFREVLEEYGADYVNTMERVLNDKTLYVRLLDMLMKDDNMQSLKVALQEQDTTKAFEAAHTLKGMTANMGLTPLVDAICEIVEPLRAGEIRTDYMDLYQNIEDEFKKVAELQIQLQETII